MIINQAARRVLPALLAAAAVLGVIGAAPARGSATSATSATSAHKPGARDFAGRELVQNGWFNNGPSTAPSWILGGRTAYIYASAVGVNYADIPQWKSTRGDDGGPVGGWLTGWLKGVGLEQEAYNSVNAAPVLTAMKDAGEGDFGAVDLGPFGGDGAWTKPKISQHVLTVPGRTYTLSWWTSAAPWVSSLGTGSVIDQAAVTDGSSGRELHLWGNSKATAYYQDSVDASANCTTLKWVHSIVTFTAGSDDTVITVKSLQSQSAAYTDRGPLVTGISVR